jgi:hypothetical protein
VQEFSAEGIQNLWDKQVVKDAAEAAHQKGAEIVEVQLHSEQIDPPW